MLRFIIFALAASLAACELDIGIGEWYPLRVYVRPAPVVKKGACTSFSFHIRSDSKCKCGGEKVPTMNLHVEGDQSMDSLVFPYIMVEEGEKATDALAATCSCSPAANNVHPKQFVFKPITDKYFLMYNAYAGPNFALLFGRTEVSKQALDSFANTQDILKELNDYADICVLDSSQPSGHMQAATSPGDKTWFNFVKN